MTIVQGLIASVAVAAGGGGGTTTVSASFSGDDPNHGSFGQNGWWYVNGNASSYSIFSGTPPSFDAQSWPAYNGHVYTFTGNEYIIGPGIDNYGTSEITINYWFYPTSNDIQLVSEYGSQDPGSGYHYTILEIDSSGYVHGRFWPNTTPGMVTSNAVQLNKWNHVYFYQALNGYTYLQLNNGAATSTNTSVRQGAGTSYFAFGVADATNLGSTGRFQGKIGRFQYDNNVNIGSDYWTYKSVFDPYPVELGTAGTSTVFESGTVPSSGSTWPAAIGSDATIQGSYSLDTSGGVSGISLSSYYIEVPVNLNQGNWTVELVCSLNPSSYWATIWGNEVYDSHLGYIAYMGGPGGINYGSPNGQDSINATSLGIDVATRAHWVFTNTGGTLAVYRNGAKLPVNVGYNVPAGVATSNLYIGSRHGNSGTGSTDSLPGTYYFVRVRDYGLTQSDVSSAYSALQSTYGV